MYESSFVTTGSCIGYESVIAMAALCEITTPFDEPVVPDVYMITAASSGLTPAAASTGCARPACCSSPIEKTSILEPSLAAIADDDISVSASSAPSAMIVTTCFRVGQCGAEAARVLKSFASHMQVVASVWLREVVTPSSPRVAYAVTTIPPWRKIASAATIQSRWVSAKMRTLSPGFMPVFTTSPAPSAVAASASCEDVQKSKVGASVSFSNFFPLISSISRFRSLRHPTA